MLWLLVGATCVLWAQSSLIHQAVSSGDLEQVRAALQTPIGESWYCGAMVAAVEAGRLDMVELFAQRDLPHNNHCKYPHQVLEAAIRHGDMSIVMVALSLGKPDSSALAVAIHSLILEGNDRQAIFELFFDRVVPAETDALAAAVDIGDIALMDRILKHPDMAKRIPDVFAKVWRREFQGPVTPEQLQAFEHLLSLPELQERTLTTAVSQSTHFAPFHLIRLVLQKLRQSRDIQELVQTAVAHGLRQYTHNLAEGLVREFQGIPSLSMFINAPEPGAVIALAQPAVLRSLIETAQLLLTPLNQVHVVNPNTLIEDAPILFIAAVSGNLALVQELIERGADTTTLVHGQTFVTQLARESSDPGHQLEHASGLWFARPATMAIYDWFTQAHVVSSMIVNGLRKLTPDNSGDVMGFAQGPVLSKITRAKSLGLEPNLPAVAAPEGRVQLPELFLVRKGAELVVPGGNLPHGLIPRVLRSSVVRY